MRDRNMKSDIITDKKYRASFKKMHSHTCWITGQQFTEYASHSVTACHITVGRYGKNIKDDCLIIPIRQDLHMIMDRNQPQFFIKHFYDFPDDRREAAIQKVIKNGKYEITAVVKQMARDYYEEWLTDNKD